jgi:small subunit ribosomal protein S21
MIKRVMGLRFEVKLAETGQHNPYRDDFIWFCRATLQNNLKFSWKDSKTQMQVSVRDNNVDQALRALKKKLQREGVFREMRLKEHFEKPSVRKAREQKEAVSRQRKLARKKAEREG